jgi:hypothetical protein
VNDSLIDHFEGTCGFFPDVLHHSTSIEFFTFGWRCFLHVFEQLAVGLSLPLLRLAASDPVLQQVRPDGSRDRGVSARGCQPAEGSQQVPRLRAKSTT